MSLVTPASVTSAMTVQPRDALAMPTLLRTAPAVSATLTQAAVQQAQASNRSDLLTRRDTVPFEDRRNRLVGPPPTFDGNVLQHMRETRNDPAKVNFDGPITRHNISESPKNSRATPDTDGQQTPVRTVYEQLHPKDTAKLGVDTVDARF